MSFSFPKVVWLPMTQQFFTICLRQIIFPLLSLLAEHPTESSGRFQAEAADVINLVLYSIYYHWLLLSFQGINNLNCNPQTWHFLEVCIKNCINSGSKGLGPISLTNLTYFPSHVVYFIIICPVSKYFSSPHQNFTQELVGESHNVTFRNWLK